MKKRPKVICHMIESVDGRLHPDRWSDPYQDVCISECYEAYAAKFPAQAWMVGRTTLAEFDDLVQEKESAIVAQGVCHACVSCELEDGQTMAVVLDPKAKLHYKASTIPDNQHIVTVVGKGVSQQYLDELEEIAVSYIIPENISDLSEILETLHSVFGIRTLLLEGGGVINGSFLDAGLIDELSVLIYPAVDGLSGVSSIIGYKPADGSREALPAAKTHLQLLNHEVNPNGLVWLHYAMHNEA